MTAPGQHEPVVVDSGEVAQRKSGRGLDSGARGQPRADRDTRVEQQVEAGEVDAVLLQCPRDPDDVRRPADDMVAQRADRGLDDSQSLRGRDADPAVGPEAYGDLCPAA